VQIGNLTHDSVHAYNLEESARFYKEVFGMDEIPAPSFYSLCAGCRWATCNYTSSRARCLLPRGTTSA
jgi:hypothetical protein